jgi:hypothetical protein
LSILTPIQQLEQLYHKLERIQRNNTDEDEENEVLPIQFRATEDNEGNYIEIVGSLAESLSEAKLLSEKVSLQFLILTSCHINL